MTERAVAVFIAIIIAAAVAYFTEHRREDRRHIYWCFNGAIGAGLPYQYVKAERSV